MQLEQKYDRSKRLQLILGKKNIQKLRNVSILLVGVGGIGCEVLKNLSKHPIKKVTIIDLDIIQISNLNRQFYFRKQHLAQSKAKVARQQLLNLTPDFNIEAIQGSIYDKQFNNYRFYSQFDFVISALDNLKARQHLAKNCTRFGKILIDAGTSGFYGQSYFSRRFVTSCHNCYSSVQDESFAVCTIRSRPERSIHCAIYAKNIYEQFFSNDNEPWNDRIKQIKKKILQFSHKFDEERLKQSGIQLFDYLFCHQFKSNQFENGFQVKRLTFEQSSKSHQPFRQNDSNSKDDSIWSLQQYSQGFLDSFCNLIKRLFEKGSKLSLFYDKDDNDCSLFICCLCNLRVHNFKNQKTNKLNYLTNYQCRKLIGKIIPAIASTNSIAASLQIKQLLDLVSNQKLNPKYFTLSPTINQKISFSWLSLPNPQCEICSPHNIYFQVKCNLSQTTFQEFQQFTLNNCFSHYRDLYCQKLILIKNVNSNKISPNKKKNLNFKPQLIVENILTLTYLPTSKISDLKVQITLIDEEIDQKDGSKFIILNKQQVERTIQVLNSLKKSSFINSNSLQDKNLGSFEKEQLEV